MIRNTQIHRIFFVLLLLFLPTQIGLHLWPQWAHVLGRRVDYLSPTIFLTDVLLILVVGSWMWSERKSIVYRVLSIVDKKTGKNTIQHTQYAIPLIAFLFISFSIFFAASPMVALYKWVKAVEFGLLGLYIVKTKPSLFIIHTSLFIALLYSSLIAITQFTLQHSVGGFLWFLGERTFAVETPGIARVFVGRELLRAYGTFPHPNVLGGFIAALLPLLIGQIGRMGLIRHMSWKKSFYVTVFLVGVVALLLTFSRSAIVVFVLSIVYWVWRKNQLMKNWIPAFAGMTVGLVCLFLLIPLSIGDESVVVRQQLNAVAIKQFASSPIFGVGLGNFLVRLPDTLPSREIYFLQPVHNIYLLLLAEIGIVGIGLMSASMIFLYSVLRIAYRRKRKQETSLYLIRYSLYTILFLGLVDHYWLTLQQGQLLLTILLAKSLDPGLSPG